MAGTIRNECNNMLIVLLKGSFLVSPYFPYIFNFHFISFSNNFYISFFDLEQAKLSITTWSSS